MAKSSDKQEILEEDQIPWDPKGRWGWWFSKRMVMGQLLLLIPVGFVTGAAIASEVPPPLDLIGLPIAFLTPVAVTGVLKSIFIAQGIPREEQEGIERFFGAPKTVYALAIFFSLSNAVTMAGTVPLIGLLAAAAVWFFVIYCIVEALHWLFS